MEQVHLNGAYFEMRSKRTQTMFPFFVTSVMVITSWDVGDEEHATTDATLTYVRRFADLATDYRGTIQFSELTDPEMSAGFEFAMPAWLASIVERGTPRL